MIVLRNLAPSPDGKYLVICMSGMQKLANRLPNFTVKPISEGPVYPHLLLPFRANIATFSGHSSDIQDLAFSPDRTMLATGSYDKTILLWNLKPYIGA